MIIFLGVSGAGKGTQATRMAAEINYTHISTGDMIRNYGTPEQHERLQQGILVTDDDMNQMMDRALAAIPDAHKSILDGFPRTLSQAQWLVQQVAAGRFSIEAIIVLTLNSELVHQRLEGRHRPDDTPEAIAARIQWYAELTAPLIRFFVDNGVAVHEIDGGQSVDQVHEAIARALSLLPVLAK